MHARLWARAGPYLAFHPIGEGAFAFGWNLSPQDACFWTDSVGSVGWGEYPIGGIAVPHYHAAMNLILIILVLLLLFGGGGFYFGGPAYGGGGLGLILLICLIIYLMGGFRGRK